MAGVPRNQLAMQKLVINQAIERMGVQRQLEFPTDDN